MAKSNVGNILLRFAENLAAAMQRNQEITQARKGTVTLTPEQAQLVAISLAEFDGAFPVHRLAHRTGLSDWCIRTLSQEWEACGLLTVSTSGSSHARQVTPRLREMARSIRQDS
jgi:hypothetical protein